MLCNLPKSRKLLALKNSARIMTAFPGNRMGGVFYDLYRNTPVHEVSPLKVTI